MRETLLLPVVVPAGDHLVAAVALRLRPDGRIAVQEYRDALALSQLDMASALGEFVAVLSPMPEGGDGRDA